MNEDIETLGTLGAKALSQGPVLPAGSTFAGYRILGVAGRGGMGTVYRAQDPTLGRTIALKVISPQLAEDPAFREMFAQESRRAASVEHANIVPIYASGSDNGRLFIAMRFIDGTTLSKKVRTEGPLPPNQAVAIVEQLASALDAIHERGLVHRDVKPGNVMLAESPVSTRLPDAGSRPKPHVFLTDFGLADTPVGVGVRRSLTAGTPGYTSPEQQTANRIDHRIDVYALGRVAEFMLTGAPGSAERETPLRSRRSLVARLVGVARQACAPDPDDRFASAGTFSIAMRAVTHREPRVRLRLGKRAAVTIGAIGIAATAVGSVALLMERRADRQRTQTARTTALVVAARAPTTPTDRKTLFAWAAFDRSPGSETERLLRSRIQADGLVFTESSSGLLYSRMRAAGDRVLVTRFGGEIELWGPMSTTGVPPREVIATEFGNISVAMTARGPVATGADGQLVRFDGATGARRVLGTFPVAPLQPYGVSADPAADRILVWRGSRVWEMRGGLGPPRVIARAETGGEVTAVDSIARTNAFLLHVAGQSIRLIGDDGVDVFRVDDSEFHSTAISGNGEAMAFAEGETVLIRRRDGGDWRSKHTIRVPRGEGPVALDREGRHIAFTTGSPIEATTGFAVASTDDGTVTFNGRTPSEISELVFDDSGLLLTDSPGISAWDWRFNGGRLTTLPRPVVRGGLTRAAGGRGASVIDVRGGVSELRPDRSRRGTAPPGRRVFAAATATDGRISLVGDQSGDVWLTTDGTRSSATLRLGAAIRGLDIDASGTRGVALRADGRVISIDLERFSFAPVDDTGVSFPTAVAISPDGTWIAAGHSAGEVTLTGPDGGTRLVGRHGQTVRSIAFDRSGRRLLSGGADGLALLWDGTRSIVLGRSTDRVDSVAFSDDGRQAIAGGPEGIIVWDLDRPGMRLVDIDVHARQLAVVGPGPTLAVERTDGAIAFVNCIACGNISELRGLVEQRFGREVTASAVTDALGD